MLRLLVLLLTFLCCAGAIAQSKDHARLLRSLERGDPDTVEVLRRSYPLQSMTALAQALSQRDPRMRRTVASALWSLAEVESYRVQLETEAGAALEAALGDPDGRTAMNAAGALQALGRSREFLAESRRRVLSTEPDAYPRFLAARGLIGLEPAAVLAPPLIDFLIVSAPPGDTGSTTSSSIPTNLRIAREALQRQLSQDRDGTVPHLLAALDQAGPALPSLLVLAHGTRSRIPDWPQRLLGYTRWPDAPIRERAWALLGELNHPRDAAVWVPEAARQLPDAERPGDIIAALRQQGGASVEGADALADFAADQDRPPRERSSALSALEHAVGAVRTHSDPAARQRVLDAGRRAAVAVLHDPKADTDLVRAAFSALRECLPEGGERAARMIDLAVELEIPARQVEAMRRLEDSGRDARAGVERLRPLLESPYPEVRTAARAALDAIDPAWQARDVRAAKPLAPAAPPPPPRPAEPQVERDTRPAAAARGGGNFPALYEAIRKGDLKAFRGQLDAGLPVNQAQQLAPSAAFRITPLQAVVDYCQITQLVDTETLVAMARLLMQRGADPGLKGSRDRSALETAWDNQCPEPLKQVLLGE